MSETLLDPAASGGMWPGAPTSAMDALLRDATGPQDDDDADMEAYEAGMRPTPEIAGAPWQEETVYELRTVTDDDVMRVVLDYLGAAERYNAALSGERVRASEAYRGERIGDEEAGRSQIVQTVVRDTIRSTLPSLLRIFTGIQYPVEFTPAMAGQGPQQTYQAELAAQATDYATWALFVANPGWRLLHDALLDALTRKAGWLTWHWGSVRKVRTEVCQGLLEPQLRALLAQPGVQAIRVARRPMLPEEQAAAQASPEGAFLAAGGPPMLYSARITRTAAEMRPVIEYVPVESVWIVADADDVQTARAVFIVMDTTPSALAEAGLPVDDLPPGGSTVAYTGREESEKRARDALTGANLVLDVGGDETMKRTRYVRGWVRLDTDGDGIAELVAVHVVNGTLVQWERTDDVPLACFTCYREPARLIGDSQADYTMDLQKTQTRVLRSILDSMGQSIFPRTVAVVGQVNLSDVKQTAIGAIIRASQPGAVSELAKPFIGPQCLPIVELLESVREQRTGITRTHQGLTAESLQSTTQEAVAAQVDAAQDRIDMLARTLAETGLAPLYAGLLRLLARQQDRPTLIRLRGKWVPVDPRALESTYELQVNVGGRGSQAQRLSVLTAIAGKQEEIMKTTGIDNPLCSVPEYRNALGDMAATANIADPTRYFKTLPPGWAPPPPSPPKPSTDEILAEIERLKTIQRAASDRAQQETARIKMLVDDDRQRDEAALNAWVQVYVAAANNGTPLPSIGEFKEAMKNDIPIPAAPSFPDADMAPPAAPAQVPPAGPMVGALPGMPAPGGAGLPTVPPGLQPAGGQTASNAPPPEAMQQALRMAVMRNRVGMVPGDALRAHVLQEPGEGA